MREVSLYSLKKVRLPLTIAFTRFNGTQLANLIVPLALSENWTVTVNVSANEPIFSFELFDSNYLIRLTRK